MYKNNNKSSIIGTKIQIHNFAIFLKIDFSTKNDKLCYFPYVVSKLKWIELKFNIKNHISHSQVPFS